MTKAISRQNNYSQVNMIARFSAEKQADRILFGYGGDRLCKGAVTDGAIALQKKALMIAQFVRSGKLSSFRLSPNHEEFVW
jgi:hypothetical protein